MAQVKRSSLFAAATATATSSSLDVAHLSTHQFYVKTTGFSGTLDLQESYDDGATWVNSRYFLKSARAESAAQLSYTTDTNTYVYQVMAAGPLLRLNMTRSAGSVTAWHFGRDEGDAAAYGVGTPAAIAASSSDVHEPASNTAAVVTYAAAAGVRQVITGAAWSYSGGDPTGGNLKIEDVSGTTVFSMDITSQGAGLIAFPQPKKSAAVNTALIITLAAGGGGVTGKVSILNHWTE